MAAKDFDRLLKAWEPMFAKFDKRLATRYQQPFDFADPKALAKLIASNPLSRDKAFRRAYHDLVHAMVLVYLEGDTKRCQRVRELLERYPSFLNSLCLPGGKPLRTAKDAEWFRKYLAVVSMKDQGMDMRDELLNLAGLLRDAKKAKIKTGPILEEIAAISSNVNKQGLGSMQKTLRTIDGPWLKELLGDCPD